MYIDHGKWNQSKSDFEYDDRLSSLETPSPEMNTGEEPGYAPVSPETPSWGPPVGEEPGFAPISPETPSWGPPVGEEPGFAPISPETPSWGPPSSGGGSIGGIGSIIGGGSSSARPPVIVVPGVTISPNRPAEQSVNIRFLHAAPTLAGVNVSLGNQTMINNLQFGNATPYYLATGNQRTMITITSSRNGSILYRGYFYFAGRTAYTVSIVENGSRISLYVLADAPCNRTNYGCLRAVNLSPNSGAVDVFLSGYGRLFRNLSPYSYTNYRMISQGTYRASVSEALPCTNDNAVTMTEDYVECNNTRIVIMDTATVNIMNGVTYTLYLIGMAYQFPALQILPLESDLIY